MFTDKEIAYMKAQPWARIDTVSTNSQPDVSPVGFRFDGQYLKIGGMRNSETRKYKNVAAGNTLVALAIDDLKSVDPWRPRGIKIYGLAEIDGGDTLRIKPMISWSWNVEGPSIVDGRFVPRKTVHE